MPELAIQSMALLCTCFALVTYLVAFALVDVFVPQTRKIGMVSPLLLGALLGLLVIFQLNSRSESHGKSPFLPGELNGHRHAPSIPVRLKPEIAESFVEWWLIDALNYAATGVDEHHRKTARWLSPDAAKLFETIFWDPRTDKRCNSLVFLPTDRMSTVMSDDVVEVSIGGVLIDQSRVELPFKAIQIQFDVLRDQDGYRMRSLKVTNDLEGLEIRRFIQSTLDSHNNTTLKLNQRLMPCFKKGLWCFDHGDKKGAIDMFDQAIDLYPKFTWAYFKRGNAKLDIQDYHGALSDLDQAIKLCPQFASAHCSRGLARSRLKDTKGAMKDYDRAIALDPNCAHAFNNRGCEWDALGDKRRAIVEYSQAIRLERKIATFYYNRAHAFADLGKMTSAKRDYSQAIRINPSYSDAYYNRGHARSDTGDKLGAIEDWSQAIKINPKDAMAYFNRARARVSLGDENGAIKDYDQVVKLNPTNVVVGYRGRGYARFILRDDKGAIEDFDKAILLNSKDSWTYSRRAAARAGLGDWRNAIADYNETIRLDPKDGSAYFYRGNALLAVQEKKRAIDSYSAAIQLLNTDDSEPTNAYNNRGVARLRCGDIKGAREDFIQATQLNRNASASLFNCFIARLLLGDLVGALNDCKEALRRHHI